MMMVMKESENVYSSTSGAFKSKRLRRKPDQHFTSYISFGFGMTIFLAIVLVLYLILLCYFALAVFQPRSEHRPVNNSDQSLHQQKQQPLTAKMRSAFEKFRQKVSDNQFVSQVQQEISQLRQIQKLNSTTSIIAQVIPNVNDPKETKSRHGFIVLGMHRSGTSMLSGLLVTGMGYIDLPRPQPAFPSPLLASLQT